MHLSSASKVPYTNTRALHSIVYTLCCNGTILYNINCIHRIILFKFKHAHTHIQTHPHPYPHTLIRHNHGIPLKLCEPFYGGLCDVWRCGRGPYGSLQESGIRSLIGPSSPPSTQLFGNSGISFVSGRNVKNRKRSRIPID